MIWYRIVSWRCKIMYVCPNRFIHNWSKLSVRMVGTHSQGGCLDLFIIQKTIHHKTHRDKIYQLRTVDLLRVLGSRHNRVIKNNVRTLTDVLLALIRDLFKLWEQIDSCRPGKVGIERERHRCSPVKRSRIVFKDLHSFGGRRKTAEARRRDDRWVEKTAMSS